MSIAQVLRITIFTALRGKRGGGDDEPAALLALFSVVTLGVTTTCSASPVQGGTLMALGVSITSFFQVFLFPAWARIRREQAMIRNRGKGGGGRGSCDLRHATVVVLHVAVALFGLGLVVCAVQV